MAENVLLTRSRISGEGRKRSRCCEPGVARICWTFFEPARCVRMEGHLIAADRSRCRRDDQAVALTYSWGEYPARK